MKELCTDHVTVTATTFIEVNTLILQKPLKIDAQVTCHMSMSMSMSMSIVSKVQYNTERLVGGK
jgi:hypothetical protein